MDGRHALFDLDMGLRRREFIQILLAGQLAPHTLDPKKIGYWFSILVFSAPLIGAFGAFFGYRRSPDFQPD